MLNSQVICFGEVLWDIFPDRKVIGGAPLNVAARLHSYGVPAAVISCLGNDKNGLAALQYFDEHGLSSQLVQKHTTLETGSVEITLDERGSASYVIRKPVAWDAIKLTPQLISEVQEAPFFLFGSLAVRGAMNRHTLQALMEVAKNTIFDVNLRPPHFDISMVYELMQRADFIKLNDEELEIICNRLGCQKQRMRDQMQWLSTITNTRKLCVTRGADGAILLYENQFFEHPGFLVTINDTVGAGDSFLATLVNELLLKNESPDQALLNSCAVGALVASKKGANCQITSEEIGRFIAKT